MADNVFDVAAYILGRQGQMTAWKLQKLVYYSQAWSLVWDDAPLFSEPIEAWANGPVCPALYASHRGKFTVGDGDIFGDPGKLGAEQCETVDAVLRHYGHFTPQYLSELTHSERPWIESRDGLPAGARGSNPIPLDLMAEYYGGL